MLSSPAGTKSFQFPAYTRAIVHGAQFGNPRFKGWHAPTLGLSQLATAFVVTRAKPSTRWLKFLQACFSSNQLQICNLISVHGLANRTFIKPRKAGLNVTFLIKQNTLSKHKPLIAHVGHKRTKVLFVEKYLYTFWLVCRIRGTSKAQHVLKRENAHIAILRDMSSLNSNLIRIY